MAQLQFETLGFKESKNFVVVTLLNLFKTKIPENELKRISDYKIIDSHTIEFDLDEDKARFRLAGLLEKYFENLTNKLTGNKVTYIHRNSGIPLIGNVAFGIVNRGSSIIEIKPVTSCNLDCVYCSISEGLSSKKNDFVVEKDYLVEELQKLLDGIDERVEIHIGVQGEPFLYADMFELIKDLQGIDKIHTISIDTNGTLLNKEKIDVLASCNKQEIQGISGHSLQNKLQINFSLDAIDSQAAKKIAGVNNYNVEHVKEMIACAARKLKVIVAPVFTDGYNNQEMEKIIKWVKSLEAQPILGIQNFLKYKTGRNPGSELSWDEFYKMLSELEKKYEIKLKLNKDDFNVKDILELEKPFKVGDDVNAVIKCVDRFSNSVIVVSYGRNISVPNCKFVKDKKIKVKITRDKHNIFSGKLI